MYRSAAIFTILVVMGAGINADLIAVDEIDLVNMIQPLQGEDYQCSKQGEIFCDTPTPPCEVGCMSIEKCWRLTCTGVCPGLDPKPFSGADLTSVCQSIVATLKVLKTGLIDFKDTTFYQKFTATTYLFVMGFDVCDDGRIVCDEVAGGCVDFDDACNDDGRLRLWSRLCSICPKNVSDTR
ncbi:uncharacterized protein [Ptychodera flava]|uniref:uncharacterized protein n=1 Tax=Ptychodera flava TaxID=63121 RepID=UPI003969E9CB